MLLAHAVVLPLPVHRLEQIGHPADAALDGDERQVREAMRDARENHVGDAASVLERRHGGDAREVRLHADVRGILELLGEAAAADVETDRHSGFLGRRPDRIPVPVAQHRRAVILRLIAEDHRLVAARGTALDLAHRGGEIPERRRHDRNQAPRVCAAPFEQEVVVGAHALEHQLRVAEAQEAAGAEAADVRVDHVAPELLLVHPGEAGLRVVHRGRDVLIALAHVGEGAGVTRGRVRARHAAGLIADEPEVDAVHVADVRYAVAPLARDARRPHVGGLGDVRVDVDDAMAVEEHWGPRRWLRMRIQRRAPTPWISTRTSCSASREGSAGPGAIERRINAP